MCLSSHFFFHSRVVGFVLLQLHQSFTSCIFSPHAPVKTLRITSPMTHPLLSLRTSAPSLPSFSDNPPSLQVGLDTLTSSFHPIFSSCSYSRSSSFTKALYFHIPLPSVSCLWDLICRTSSAAIAALTAQICLSAQGLSPSVQRKVSV